MCTQKSRLIFMCTHNSGCFTQIWGVFGLKIAKKGYLCVHKSRKMGVFRKNLYTLIFP